MKGYKDLQEEYAKEIKSGNLTPRLQRLAMDEWKKGYDAATQSMPDWYKDMPPFLDPEYRIHPLMGHQVRSRRVFTREGSSREERDAEKKHVPRAHPRITPYELDPEYRDKGEKEHGKADLKGVKQYPVSLDPEPTYPEPSFDHIKSDRLKRSVEILELKIGYDHKSNKHVLYTPLKYNERWDRQSQAVWLRVAGMSPKRIGIKLNIKYDTIKNWMRALKNQPLVGATQYDWAVRQVDGKPELSSKHSSIEAKGRTPEVI